MARIVGAVNSAAARYVSRMHEELGPADRARAHRLILIAIITAVIEIGLYLLAHFGPAFQGLVKPVYWIVLGVAAITVWHALRRRGERRHADRRRTRREAPRDASQ